MRLVTENPFCIVFGKIPKAEIERTQIIEEIKAEFCAENPSNQVVLFTGVRGSGKSAITSKLMQCFAENKDWIVTDLLVENDMLSDLLGKLKDEQGTRALMQDMSVSISVSGFNIGLREKKQEQNIKNNLDKILEEFTRKGKKILVVVDDVAPTQSMKIFAHFFHSCLMKNYSIFLIMNGVYDNIQKLQNADTLTFLQRAPKISIGPLNLMSVARLYSKAFGFEEKILVKMAGLTEGFAYAVQALGYLIYKQNNIEQETVLTDVLPDFDDMLANGVYEKLWSELTENNKEVVRNLAETENRQISSSEMLSRLSCAKAQLSTNKKELIKKGILKNQRGIFEFALPRFKAFVLNQELFL